MEEYVVVNFPLPLCFDLTYIFSIELWLYERCPTVTGTALVVAGGVLFTSAVTGALSYVGSTSASGAAGNLTFFHRRVNAKVQCRKYS